MARKYLIETYGCQMNVHDSERMAGLLEAAGFEPTDADEDADLVVINTCSVREKAEEKLYTRLGDLKGLRHRVGHAPMVAVTGCVAQQEAGQVLARSPLVDVVVGTQRARMLPMLVERAAAAAEPLIDVATPYDEPTFPFGLTRRGDPGQGLRHHRRGLQRLLHLLRRALHPRTRADAGQGRDPRARSRRSPPAGAGRCSCSARS